MYGIMTILLCAFVYATLFSMIAIITGDSVIGVYWILFKISLPIGLLVGYNAWTVEPRERYEEINVEMRTRRHNVPPVF